jgi:hypothetical protein
VYLAVAEYGIDVAYNFSHFQVKETSKERKKLRKYKENENSREITEKVVRMKERQKGEGEK